jgi:hypothetical protein
MCFLPVYTNPGASMRYAVIACVTCTFLLGCSTTDQESADTLTRREKDSIVAESGLPGAGGVRGAITGADSAAARAARLDSLSRVP